jgi:uncharacterized protein with PIN domain
LLCDEMLHGLARWLRAAGHDTLVAASGTPDVALVRRAAEDGRTLLTRDRRLAAAAEAAGVAVHVPAAADLDALAHELGAALGLGWAEAPFTRCLVENAPLRPAAPGDLARVPAASRGLAAALKTCPECGRLYWPGSHFRRMARRLEAWRRPG